MNKTTLNSQKEKHFMLSLQRATWLDLTRSALLCYFYPRSRGFGCLGGGISIHALLAESDNRVRLSPLGPKYFYPRSPCGERHELSERRWRPSGISIHALLAESDVQVILFVLHVVVFLSTLSLRRATAMGQLAAQLNEISIHALLAESDRKRCQSRPDSRNFYPRSPCGERLTTLTTSRRTEQFLSTLSLRRATCRLGLGLVRRAYFYPRSPCGERHATILVLHNPQYFYPRSPCGERR